MSIAPSPLMQDLIRLALAAGREIMAIYATDFSAKAKEDLTPVTEADEIAKLKRCVEAAQAIWG